MCNKNEIRKEIKNMRLSMWWTNFFFHFTRNNPRHRDQYYARLIAVVGYDKWKYVEPSLRMSWESAQNSFDKMYGLVKAFATSKDIYAATFTKASTYVTEPKVEFDGITENTAKEMMAKIGDLNGSIKSISETVKALNDLEKVNAIIESANKIVETCSNSDKKD